MGYCEYCKREVKHTKSGRLVPHGEQGIKYVGDWQCPMSLSDGRELPEHSYDATVELCIKRMERAGDLNTREAGDVMMQFYTGKMQELAEWSLKHEPRISEFPESFGD